MFNDQQRVARSRVWNSNAHVSLRSNIASVSNRVIARKSERKQKKEVPSFPPPPPPPYIFLLLSQLSKRTSQAMLMLTSTCQPKVVFHSFLCLFFLNSNYCCTFTAPPPPFQPHVSNLNLSFYCPFTDWSHSNVLKKVSCKHAGCYVVVVLRQLF